MRLPVNSTANSATRAHAGSMHAAAPAHLATLAARSWVGSAAVALFYYLFQQVDQAWWRWDDPQILVHAQTFSPWESYFSPTVWRELSAAHLTPWLPASFGIDLRLFGLAPWAFYSHQVAALTLACVMLYVVGRQWYSRAAALAAPIVVAFSPTALAMTQQLMTRHYVEGLLFALVAVWLFVRALRRQCMACGLLAALFYLLAASAKEVYVPLAILLVFLPEGTFRQRLTYAFPILIAAVLYAVWRVLMLGVAIGGYSGKAATLGAILDLPMVSMSYLVGPGKAALAVLAAATAIDPAGGGTPSIRLRPDRYTVHVRAVSCDCDLPALRRSQR